MNGDESIELETGISLYFHIPFCTRKCDYCHFFVLPDQELNKERLLKGFIQEWQSWLPHIKNKPIVSIYFGGGTPSLFGPERISTLLNLIYKEATVSSDAEITLEANPDLLTFEKLVEYRLAGINRLSIGIQSLSDLLLKEIGRLHDAAAAIRSVELAAKAGYQHLSIDLMYDLPNQTLEIWKETLLQAVELPITHLSLYNLTIEPHTVFFKKQKLLKPLLPNEEISLEMYKMAHEILENNGLSAYEISAFARQGDISRHNIGYWTGRPFLGLGPSAFSYWEGKRFRNVANLNKYCQALDKGESPIDFEEKLGTAAHLRELLAIEIRLKRGLRLEDFERRHGRLEDVTYQSIDKLIQQGWVKEEAGLLTLTESGVLFYDSVATELV